MKNKVIDLFSNTKVVQNKGVKYSELLEKFMGPFSDDFSHIGYIEDIFEFALNAWNFGNIKVLMPQEEFERATDLIQEEEEENYILLNKMVDYKVTKFKEYPNFIIDYELTETNADPILKVITQSEEDYLSNMMNTLDNEPTQNDFEENYINRSAIVLKPQQPFLDWYFSLYPDDIDDEEDIKQTNIYLVTEEIDDLDVWLKKKFDKFFMMELEEWHLNKKEWPQRRNYKMFKLWFQIDISIMVYDLEKTPIVKHE